MKVEIDTELLKKYIEVNCYENLGDLTEEEMTSILENLLKIEIQNS